MSTRDEDTGASGPGESIARAITRREFLRICNAMAGAAGAFAITGCDPGAGAADDAGGADGGTDAGPPDPPLDLPSLGGAPDTAQGRTIAAFCDTVVPGAWRDPEGRPGAIDVGAVASFFDPELPAARYVPLLSTFLDSYARRLAGATFVRAAPAQRDDVLDALLVEVPLVDFAVQLAKLLYLASDPAAAYLGFPGANPGYVRDADFSFGVALASEITTDGNLP